MRLISTRLVPLSLSTIVCLLGCVEPQYKSGRLHCAAQGRACPDNFYCGADGLCWQTGSGPEIGQTEDLAGVDLAGVDLAGVDLAGRDLATPPDLAQPADLLGVDGSPPSLCSTAGALLCDGFEGASLNARWTLNAPNGSATIDSTRSFRGGSSLHLHTNASSAAAGEWQANIETYDGMPVPSPGTLYSRVWAFFPAGTPVAYDQFYNFADGSGGGTACGIQDNAPVVNDYAGGHYLESASTTISVGRWECLSISIAQTASTGAVHAFLNDAEVSDVGVASASTQRMTHLYLGIDLFNTPASLPATDVWLDELLIDNKPVTCAE